MTPYEPALISKLLRAMPAERFAAATAIQFQTWPAAKITPAKVIKELIENEKARRRRPAK